ncbi:MAG: GIY-YIG nuclease family protein, partial [Oxalobacteraceae bacterium]
MAFLSPIISICFVIMILYLMDRVATIYVITNHINNKKYVGFTTFSIQKRWREHCTSSRDSLMRRAIKKYGSDSFSISAVVCTPDIGHALNVLEEKYIRQFNSHAKDGHGYNANYGGSAIRLDHTPSESTRLKMSNSHKGRPRSQHFRVAISKA